MGFTIHTISLHLVELYQPKTCPTIFFITFDKTNMNTYMINDLILFHGVLRIQHLSDHKKF